MPSTPKTFRPRSAGSLADSSREYEQRRGSARERGYSHAWDKSSASFKRTRPLCLGCEAVGRVSVTEVIDHIEPHKGDSAKFWDTDNWQPLCDWHHVVVKQQLERLWSKGEASTDCLRIDSKMAMTLTLRLRPPGWEGG